MLIEKVHKEDLEYIEKLQPENWSGVRKNFEFYLENKDWCNPIKVKINKKIVGIGCGMSFGKTAWIGHIIVDSEYRKQGIGTYIVKDLCASLKNKGVESISLIATEYGYPVYKKIGFAEEVEYLFFKGERTLPETTSRNIVEYSEKYKDKIYALDRLISGEKRQILLEQYLEKSILYVKDDNVFGFYIPTLGHGLIVAENSEAGIELMKLRYSKTTEGVLPSENFEAIKFLENNNYKIVRRAKRMVYGNQINWNKSGLFNRIAGNFG